RQRQRDARTAGGQAQGYEQDPAVRRVREAEAGHGGIVPRPRARRAQLPPAGRVRDQAAVPAAIRAMASGSSAALATVRTRGCAWARPWSASWAQVSA